MLLMITLPVLSPIQFYGKPQSRAVEIQDVRPYTVLAKELRSMKLAVPDTRPEGVLGFRLIASQFPSPLFQRWIISQEIHQSPVRYPLITPPCLPLS